jgi:hypothetical protein
MTNHTKKHKVSINIFKIKKLKMFIGEVYDSRSDILILEHTGGDYFMNK